MDLATILWFVLAALAGFYASRFFFHSGQAY